MNEHASINRLYRLVWNECSGTWVAVSELSRGRGKRSIAGASGFGALIAVLRSLPALLALGFGCAQAAPPANTLPQGGQVVAGQAVIGSSGARLDVTQSSQRAAIDWQSFNLGANAQVNFKQPNSASVTLNRVLDAQPSQIFGRITSNGQVFLSNPAGIYFSPSSSANVGALVATTHSISTADFMAGKTGFARNGATGSVVNQGQLTADLGGYIALLAPEVRNEGVILAQAGTVALAAGEMIALQLNGSSLLNLLVEPATVAALVDNQQAVLAPGGQIILSAQAISSLQSGVIRNSGQLAADRFAEVDGRIRLEASQAIVQTGSVQGRELSARSKNLIEAGRWDASASLPGQSGGNIDIQASGHIEQTTASSLIADGQHGGSVRLSAGSDAWVSGSLSAQGRSSQGGEIALTAPTLTVAGASLDASGEQGGGRVRIGGGWQGKDADLANADSTRVSASTVNVSARAAGQGGTAVLWSERLTQLGGGQILAKGGELNGDGGRVEVSSHGQLGFGGKVDASARHGAKGELLLDPKNIEIVASASEALNILSLADANPTDDGQFGEQIAELSNNGVSTNRVLANKPGDSTVASNAGAVRLYNSLTGALISTLTGSQADDQVGWSGVTALSNGNYVVRSPNWSNGSNAYAGAVTWGNGSTGISGAVSSSNSLVGSQAGDNVGATDITKLSNGNYVVSSPNWTNGSNANAGAVTWGSGSAGVSGVVSSINSLVGSQTNDYVGSYGITALSNGNYVVRSSNWANGSNANAGAVTWGSGSTGISGVVSSSNSLVGSQAEDRVGSDDITALSNGNYVVSSSSWDSGGIANAGAVTWGNGSTGISGAVSSSNSLVGSQANDQVGVDLVTALSNGNFVVRSSSWNNGSNASAGAVTWGNGSTGISGAVSISNSLVGSQANDSVGANGVTALSNGNYVVSSLNWMNSAGAVTWGNGSTGISGAVSSSNSLVGSQAGDQVGGNGITALSNGNFVVSSSSWINGGNANAGAVTWGNGSTGISGVVSSSNSLVGSQTNDQVGEHGVTALSNGNYVVRSSNWNNGSNASAGAVTWGNGSTGTSGVVSSSNSLVGSQADDYVGGNGINELSNGNYLVRTTSWDSGSNANAGAVTWGSGSAGVSGVVSSINSLVGSQTGDRVGSSGITALSNGNYVVTSVLWDSGSFADAGAVTWGNGSTGISGVVSSGNSLVGSQADDRVGGNDIKELSNGNYVVRSAHWTNGSNAWAGAVTLGNGSTGISGAVSSSNSLVGSQANDRVGSGRVIALIDGRALVGSPIWSNSRGRVDILSFAAGSDSFSNGHNYALTPGTDSKLLASDLTALLNAGTNVTLQANSDISVSTAISANNPGGNGGALALHAGRSILINANINTDNGNLTLIANDTTAHGVLDAHRDSGNALITMGAGSSIDAGSGAVSVRLLDGAGKTHTASGDITLRTISAASIEAINTGPTAGSGITLASGSLTASTGSGDGIVLAGKDFTNNAGASALSTPGGARWLVWSGDASADTRGGLSYDFKQYNASQASSTVLGSGNGFLYTLAPTLSASLTGSVNKVYDGNTTATLSASHFSFSGAVEGDSVSLNGGGLSASFDNRNAGAGKTVTATGISFSASQGSAAVYGYTLTSSSTSGAIGSINQAHISAITGITAANKVYDGTTAATLNSGGAAFTGKIGSDVLSVATASGAFANKTAANGKTVSITGLSLGGDDAGNYVLDSNTASTTANIDKAHISTITGITAANKVYDGTTAATLSSGGAAFTGKIGSDVLSVATASGAFANKTAANGKTVAITGLSLGGSDAENYLLGSNTASTSATIEKAPISAITGITAANKVEDGTTLASLNLLQAGFVGQIAGDQLSLTQAQGEFDNAQAGLGKVVTITAMTLGGADAANYQALTIAASTKANITALPVAPVPPAPPVAPPAPAQPPSGVGLTLPAAAPAPTAGPSPAPAPSAPVSPESSAVPLGNGAGGATTSPANETGSASDATKDAAATAAAAAAAAAVKAAAEASADAAAAEAAKAATPTNTTASTAASSDLAGNSAGSPGIAVTVTRSPDAAQSGIVSVLVPRSTATAGSGFKFMLPEALFNAADTSGATPSATTLSGGALPAWLRIDASTRSFVASAVPDGALPYQLRVTIGGQSTIIVIAERAD